jgi:hypothetical protein
MFPDLEAIYVFMIAIYGSRSSGQPDGPCNSPSCAFRLSVPTGLLALLVGFLTVPTQAEAAPQFRVLARYPSGAEKVIVYQENITLPSSGATMKAGLPVELSEHDGSFRRFTLASDFRWPTSPFPLLKGNTELELFPDGKPKRYTLAKDLRDSANGLMIRAGHQVEFFPGGVPRSLFLATDWMSPRGVVFRRDTSLEHFENGQVRKGTVAKNANLGDGKVLKGGTELECYEDGSLKSFVLAKDAGNPNGIVFKAGFRIEMSPDHTPKRFMVAELWIGPSGSIFPAGSVVEARFLSGVLECVHACEIFPHSGQKPRPIKRPRRLSEDPLIAPFIDDPLLGL